MQRTRMTGFYALGHFAVDFACACLMFRFVQPTAAWGEAMLFYNFCAFALQMPLGLAADMLRRDRSFAVLGCLAVSLALCFTGAPIALSITAGIGNALYHVGGGVAVLHAYEKRAGPLGLFVSPGAFGIFFGTLLGKGTAPLTLLLPAALLLTALLLLLAAKGTWNPVREAENRKIPYLPLLCLFLVVVLRSYLGFLFAFPWKTGAWAVIAVCGVVLGKTAGGYLADRFGAMCASIASLGTAALLFCFAQNPVCGVLAIFLFNMSMPITLRAAADALPELQGFSFGLLTFALFLGFLPTWFGVGTSAAWLLAPGAAVSLLLLLPGLRKKGD